VTGSFDWESSSAGSSETAQPDGGKTVTVDCGGSNESVEIKTTVTVVEVEAINDEPKDQKGLVGTSLTWKASTNPSGHSSDIQWSANGTSESGGQFTNSFSSTGDYTVEATLQINGLSGGGSKSTNVSIDELETVLKPDAIPVSNQEVRYKVRTKNSGEILKEDRFTASASVGQQQTVSAPNAVEGTYGGSTKEITPEGKLDVVEIQSLSPPTTDGTAHDVFYPGEPIKVTVQSVQPSSYREHQYIGWNEEGTSGSGIHGFRKMDCAQHSRRVCTRDEITPTNTCGHD
jgi:hypothetical protein